MEYCSVDPEGQLLIAAVITPPPGVQVGTEQVLFVIVTLLGTILANGGQGTTHEGVKDKLSNPNSSLDPEPPASAPDHLK